jgi:hypothetical protein
MVLLPSVNILNERKFTALGEVNSQKGISLSSFFLKAQFIPNVLCQNPSLSLSASDTRRTQQRPHFCWSEKRSGRKNARKTTGG